MLSKDLFHGDFQQLTKLRDPGLLVAQFKLTKALSHHV
jgi:hypothetical protein